MPGFSMLDLLFCIVDSSSPQKTNKIYRMKEFSMTNCQRHSMKPNFSVPHGLASTSHGHPCVPTSPRVPHHVPFALALLSSAQGYSTHRSL